VLKKKGEALYARVRDFETDWLNNNVCGQIKKLLVPSLLTTVAGGPSGVSITERRSAGDRFLHGLKAAWQDHLLCMAMLADVLMYLVRIFRCLKMSQVVRG
jgi:cullin 3